MSFYTAAFATADQLIKYVNDNAIPQTSITTIQPKDGQWWLFWWA